MRIKQIDGLRGFALLGILIVNIFVFHAPYPHYSAFYGAFEGFEANIIEVVVFFFAGKFMFIYAFLFGYGFWLQREKQHNLKSFRAYWKRRMLVLAVFGGLHVLLLSFGDILLPYALLGLSLIYFSKLDNKRLFLCFLLIYLIPVYEFVLRILFTYPSVFMKPVVPLEEYIAINSSGQFLEQFKLRMNDYFSFQNEKLILYIPKELALFLLGIFAARMRLASKLNTKKAIVFCVFALAVMGSMYLFRPQIIGLFDYEQSIFQRTILGLIIQSAEFFHGMFYVIGFFLLWKIPIIQCVLQLFTYPGKLSLSNYIMQSAICVLIFSGFHYYGQLKPSALILIALSIYLFQILFSFVWLRNYQFGPLEYLWRKLSKRPMSNAPDSTPKIL